MANAHYTFLPHLRIGMSRYLKTKDTLGSGSSGVQEERGSLDISVPVRRTPLSGTESVETVSKEVWLRGPGDIKGISPQAIIKQYPADWTTNFEPNYLPYIEFYDEDFPWRYTPAKVNDVDAGNNKFRLRPWLALAVLEESEFTLNEFNGILPSFTLNVAPLGVLPDHSQLWAWAHVHVNEDLGAVVPAGITQLQNLLKDEPDKAVSRILSSRRLKPSTGYHVFLIPTFETGRLAGLGMDIPPNTDLLQSAWNDQTPGGIRFPVYHQWFFKTAVAGDFESLVRMLKPSTSPPGSGKRAVDMQLPGHPALDMETEVPVIGLEGILRPPGQQPDPWPSGSNDYTDALVTILNSPADDQDLGNPDPVIAPPIYGKWHAQVRRLSATGTNWIHEANLDPRLRIFAGAGADLVRQNQDKYMQIAWQQVGEVIEANRKIRQLQVSERAGAAVFRKHVASLSPEMLVNVASPLHAKLKLGSNTVYYDVKNSRLPLSAFSGAFRRVARPGNPLWRSLAQPTIVDNISLLQAVNAGTVLIVEPNQSPAGQSSYNLFPFSQLTRAYTFNLQQNNSFSITPPGTAVPNPTGGTNTLQGQNFVTAVMNLHDVFSGMPPYSYQVNPGLNFTNTAQGIRGRIDPAITVADLSHNQIQLHQLNGNVTTLTSLDQVMAAPKIPVPLYRELYRLSPEWLMPGLDKLARNSITVLAASQKYIEAFMLGVNDEMARELLWRDYPTDQRGTCFQFFWDYANATWGGIGPVDLDSLKDITPIHQWKVGNQLSPLGSNSGRGQHVQLSDMLILAVRGELFRRYPGALIYLQKAKWDRNPAGNPLYNKSRLPDESAAPLYPLFSAFVSPDVYFIGFGNVTAAEVKGVHGQEFQPGYFFVFEERPGDLNFGADEIEEGKAYSNRVPTWNDISWWHLLNNPSSNPYGLASFNKNVEVNAPLNNNQDDILWGANAASAAYTLLQMPFKLLVHGQEMIT